LLAGRRGALVSDPAAPFGGLCSLVSAARVHTRDCWGTPDVAGQLDCDFRSTLAGCWGNRALAAKDVQASGVCWKAC
jgi:hypothetical protein